MNEVMIDKFHTLEPPILKELINIISLQSQEIKELKQRVLALETAPTPIHDHEPEDTYWDGDY